MLSKLLQQLRQQVARYPLRFLAGAVVGGALLWVYWPTLRGLLDTWSSDAKYSHGYLVPVFAVALLWLRREQAVGAVRFCPSGWGVLVLLAGLAVRAVGTYLYLPWFSSVSIVPCVAGICVLFGGWPALRWAWPAVAFLVFMLPLPYRVEVAVAHPLQRVATLASTYTLQT
jgi:exosortase